MWNCRMHASVNTTYPTFEPPSALASADRFSWSKTQRNEYRVWLMSIAPARIEAFETWLGVRWDRITEESFFSVTSAFDAMVSGGQPFSADSELTASGHSLAADMGLLFAEFLIDQSRNALQWSIVDSPKRDVSFGLPVLRGPRADWNYIEPLGLCISRAKERLRSKTNRWSWRQVVASALAPTR